MRSLNFFENFQPLVLLLATSEADGSVSRKLEASTKKTGEQKDNEAGHRRWRAPGRDPNAGSMSVTMGPYKRLRKESIEARKTADTDVFLRPREDNLLEYARAESEYPNRVRAVPLSVVRARDPSMVRVWCVCFGGRLYPDDDAKVVEDPKTRRRKASKTRERSGARRAEKRSLGKRSLSILPERAGEF